MKFNFYKLFSVCIVALIFITGCQSKEGKVNKIQKQDELEKEEVSNATDKNIVYQYEKDISVEKVSLDKIELSDGKLKILMVAKSNDNKKVWTLDLGVSDKKETYLENSIVLLGKKYAYVAYGNTIEARDINNGKLIWNNSKETWSDFKKIVETDNGVYLITEGLENNYIIIKHSFDGKHNDLSDISFSKLVENKYFITNLDSITSVGENISINVYENSKSSNIVGKVIIDTNTGKSNFVKINE